MSEPLSPLGSGPPRVSRIDAELARLRGGERMRPPAPGGSALMALFSRTRDLIAAGVSDLLDRTDDPDKLIDMIIVEMAETLVEVRAIAASTIADQKELHRHARKLVHLQADWSDKAQLALSKGREDLARAALVEKQKGADLAQQLDGEIAVLDESLRAYEQDIEKLQDRLREARSRRAAISARLASAQNRIKLRTLLATERVDEAMARFDQLERRVDDAEGRADALGLAAPANRPNLAGDIAAIGRSDQIEAELAALKRQRGAERPQERED